MKLSLLLLKARNLLLHLSDRVVLSFMHNGSRSVYKNKVLVIRLDSIGDYLLFRNFLHELRSSEQFCNKDITLAGNELWKDLAETFDSTAVNHFIWINRKRFYTDRAYRYTILKQFYQQGYDTVIESAYSREILFGDAIVLAAQAPESIGMGITTQRPGKWKNLLFGSGGYTRFINTQDTLTFEFLRNREFFRKLLSKPELNTRLELQCTPHENKTGEQRYAIIVPGAQAAFRRWQPECFAEVINWIEANSTMHCVLCGAPDEAGLCSTVIALTKSKQAENLAGKLSLPEYAAYMQGAALAISNETGAVHLAAATNTPVICISNGHDIGRFHPYPEELKKTTIFLYPTESNQAIDKMIKNSEKVQGKAHALISEITAEKVCSQIRRMLDLHLI